MQIVNLTPHTLNIETVAGDIIAIPSSGIARVSEERTRLATQDIVCVGGVVPVFGSALGAVVGLPEPCVGTVYVVSAMVAGATMRPDVFSPGELIRDKDGKPVACRGLTAASY